jgi:polyhydroxyalkanoate synthesis regulator phasin
MAENSKKPQDDKELLYKALGVMLLIKDKFSDEFNEIFEKANASKEDILKTVDDVQSKAEAEKSQMEDRLKEKIRSVINEMGLATKEDIEALKKLIKEQKKSYKIKIIFNN